MLVYIARRLLVSIPVLLASSVLVFLMVASSGDPLAELRERNPPVPPQVIEARERTLGLDKPLPTRYVTWLGNFVQGDMGISVRGWTSGPSWGGGWSSPSAWCCWPSSWRWPWP